MKPMKVKKISKTTCVIEIDATNYSPYKNGGII